MSSPKKSLLSNLDQPLCHPQRGASPYSPASLCLDVIPAECPAEGYSPQVREAIAPFIDRPTTTKAWAKACRNAHIQHRKHGVFCVLFLCLGLVASASGIGFHLAAWMHFPFTIIGFSGAYLNRENAIRWRNRVLAIRPFKPTAEQLAGWKAAPLAGAYLAVNTTGQVPFLAGDVACLDNLVADHIKSVDTARLTAEIDAMFGVGPT